MRRGWRTPRLIGDNPCAMAKLSRRTFLQSASLAAIAATSKHMPAQTAHHRVLIGSGTKDGILAFDWNSATGELTAAGVAAHVDTVDWLTTSPDGKYLFAACEVDSFNGKPTGEVASFTLNGGSPQPLSAQNSAAKGTCHCRPRSHRPRAALRRLRRRQRRELPRHRRQAEPRRVDPSTTPSTAPTPTARNPRTRTSAASRPTIASPTSTISAATMIHIYRLDAATAMLTAAGAYRGAPGSGPRTLHFHPNGHTAYNMNELASTVDVLAWNKADGSLTRQTTIDAAARGLQRPHTRLRHRHHPRRPLRLLRQPRQQFSLQPSRPMPKPARSLP